MTEKTEYLINSIFDKLKKQKTRGINIKREEFKEYIFFLINNN